ncbi:MAG: hypothetical protein QNL65_03895 [Opitutales bacterium]
MICFRIKSRGIDERWFGSTTEAANDGRAHDEVFCSLPAANHCVCFEDHSPTEPLVILRYCDPESNLDAPEIGAD